MTVRLEELDWEKLDGKNLHITVKVMGGKAYVIEGQTVHVADLNQAPIDEQLPFFGPRSVRVGKLTDEQRDAMDLLIEKGYTVHRAAMLLGVHDSTVQARRKQLKVTNPQLPSPRRMTPRTTVTASEIDTMRRMWFEENESKAAIAHRLNRAPSVAARYIQALERGEYGGHPLALGNNRVIEHEPPKNGVNG